MGCKRVIGKPARDGTTWNKVKWNTKQPATYLFPFDLHHFYRAHSILYSFVKN